MTALLWMPGVTSSVILSPSEASMAEGASTRSGPRRQPGIRRSWMWRCRTANYKREAQGEVALERFSRATGCGELMWTVTVPGGFTAAAGAAGAAAPAAAPAAGAPGAGAAAAGAGVAASGAGAGGAGGGGRRSRRRNLARGRPHLDGRRRRRLHRLLLLFLGGCGLRGGLLIG